MFSVYVAEASKNSTNTWDEEERKGVHQIAGGISLRCFSILG